jgi:TolB protein
MMLRSLTLIASGLLALSVGAPGFAQQQALPPSNAQQAAPSASDDDGLTGSVTDENAWQDLGVAIPAFPTDNPVPTAAEGGNTGALGKSLAQVVYNDLKNNGLFKPTGPDALPGIAYSEVSAPNFGNWRAARPKCWCRASCGPRPTGG